MTLGRLARQTRALAFEWSGQALRARRRLDGSSAAILMYHRVLPIRLARDRAVEPGMFVTPETFARHLDWLEAEFRVLPLGEVVRCLETGRPLPPGACALSFDDGWRDNHDHALPELLRRRLPATVFVVTDRVGSEGAFWPDEVCRRLASLPGPERAELAGKLGAGAGDPLTTLLERMKATSPRERDRVLDRLRLETPNPGPCARELMTWEELDRLHGAGIEIESHGASHAILTQLDARELEHDLLQARDALRERGFGEQGLLAYPTGAFDPGVQRATAACGYRAAVTTERGLARCGGDRLALPRLGVHEDISSTRAEFLFRIPG